MSFAGVSLLEQMNHPVQEYFSVYGKKAYRSFAIYFLYARHGR